MIAEAAISTLASFWEQDLYQKLDSLLLDRHKMADILEGGACCIINRLLVLCYKKIIDVVLQADYRGYVSL